MKPPVEAGCTKCGQRFTLPVGADGQPIWVHVCPQTLEEKVDDLTALVKKLIDEQPKP